MVAICKPHLRIRLDIFHYPSHLLSQVEPHTLEMNYHVFMESIMRNHVTILLSMLLANYAYGAAGLDIM